MFNELIKFLEEQIASFEAAYKKTKDIEQGKELYFALENLQLLHRKFLNYKN